MILIFIFLAILYIALAVMFIAFSIMTCIVGKRKLKGAINRFKNMPKVKIVVKKSKNSHIKHTL